MFYYYWSSGSITRSINFPRVLNQTTDIQLALLFRHFYRKTFLSAKFSVRNRREKLDRLA